MPFLSTDLRPAADRASWSPVCLDSLKETDFRHSHSPSILPINVDKFSRKKKRNIPVSHRANICTSVRVECDAGAVARRLNQS